MRPTDPQFIYIILVLPALFALILIGDGIGKIVHEERSGVYIVVAGIIFLGVLGLAYLFLTSFIKQIL